MKLHDCNIGDIVKHETFTFTLKGFTGNSAILFNGSDHIVSKFENVTNVTKLEAKKNDWKVYRISKIAKAKKTRLFVGSKEECEKFAAGIKNRDTNKIIVCQGYPKVSQMTLK